jgi:hypothetical protein
MIKSLTSREIFKKCPGVKNNFGVGSSGLMVILQVALGSMAMSQ